MDSNFAEKMWSEHATSQTPYDETDAISLEKNKEFFSLKFVSLKLNDNCVEYLRNEAPSVNDEDSAYFGAPQDQNIKVTLSDDQLWQKFSDKNTEMVVTKDGRRLYPHYRVNIEGLNPDKHYCVIMDIINCDHHRYKYQNHEWVVCGVANPPPPQTYYIHPYSPALGEKWMKNDVSFHKVKLTSSASHLGYGKLLVHSMQRYQPRLHLVRADDVTKINPSLISTFNFKHTTFVTVTAYQNIEITKLKVEHNPFARGFRANGGKAKKQRARFWSPVDTNDVIACSRAQTHEVLADRENQDFLTRAHSRNIFPHPFSFQSRSAVFRSSQIASQPVCSPSSPNYSRCSHRSSVTSNEPYHSGVDVIPRYHLNSPIENHNQVVVKRETSLMSPEYSFPSYTPAPSRGSDQGLNNKLSCLNCGNLIEGCVCPMNSNNFAAPVESKQVFSTQDLNSTQHENCSQFSQQQLNRSFEHRRNTVFPHAFERHSFSNSCVGNFYSACANEIPRYYYRSQCSSNLFDYNA